jgi:hypothetical protein
MELSVTHSGDGGAADGSPDDSVRFYGENSAHCCPPLH